MGTYEQVLEKVELALAKGEYHFCINFLSSKIESFPLSSKEGANLRTILITALCGINKKEEAKKLCQELLKSYDFKTRENAKYLMEIIDSPEIKKPDNWNINFESSPSLNKKSLREKNKKKVNLIDKKFIDVTNNPTVETEPFKKGFTFIIFLILLLLIPLLSGCVKIENTLDLREYNSINNYLSVESKYLNKLPWQIKFEEEIKDIFPDAEISVNRSNFYLKNKNLSLKNARGVLQQIIRKAGSIQGGETNLEINATKKNLLLLEKNSYRIEVDLTTLTTIKDLEIYLKIIHPNKAYFVTTNDYQPEISKNLIIWNLTLGERNTLEFSFWSWNKLFIGITLVLLIILTAYSLRFYRFKLGTDFPQLPPN